MNHCNSFTPSIATRSEEERKKSIYSENLMGIYVIGTMLNNYIASVIKHKSETSKNERYTQNKLEETSKSVEKLLRPTVKFLKSVGALEPMERDILKYHDIVDEVFWMDEKDIKRISGLITKLKREKTIDA